jgi:hypothetical protein
VGSELRLQLPFHVFDSQRTVELALEVAPVPLEFDTDTDEPLKILFELRNVDDRRCPRELALHHESMLLPKRKQIKQKARFRVLKTAQSAVKKTILKIKTEQASDHKTTKKTMTKDLAWVDANGHRKIWAVSRKPLSMSTPVAEGLTQGWNNDSSEKWGECQARTGGGRQ